ncbi:MAG TPA: DegV family protein [Firmicutes bacterium]|nr:DegV family protein [Bacillota bacterium]
MAKIKLVTDSACDIPRDKEAALGIRILSFPITVNGKGYMEREDFQEEEFYDLLKNSEEIPTTAQITSFRFEEVFEEYYGEGYTDLIYVSINSKGSSTFNNSQIARDAFYEKHPDAKGKFNIYLIDSRTYTAAYGYPVMEAAVKASKGASAKELVAYIEDWLSSAKVYFAPYTLRFVKKSGRVSAAAAFVGELVGLRPLITFEDGDSVVLEKVRGDNKIVPALVNRAAKKMIPQTPYLILAAALPDRCAELVKEAEKKFGYKPVGVFQIGAAIAINAGPELVGIVVKEKREEA